MFAWIRNHIGFPEHCSHWKLCMKIVLTKPARFSSPCGSCSGLNGWAAQTLQLRCFLHSMAASVSSITTLGIDILGVSNSSAGEVSLLLSLLAPACPALQHLQLTGDVGRGLLAALGACSSKLTSLEVMHGVSSEALQQLHLLLPSLTHCRVEGTPTSWRNSHTRPCCLSLLSCISLTSLDVGSCSLTLEMWHALPESLRELGCSLPKEPLVGLRLLKSLHLFRYCCNFTGNLVHVNCLVPVLREAPNLECLVMSNGKDNNHGSNLVFQFYSPCASSSIPDLVYLHDRILSGLAVTSTLHGVQRKHSGVTLEFWMYEGNMGEYPSMAEYLAALPHFPAFKGVNLDGGMQGLSMESLMQGVKAVFPNLEVLGLAKAIRNRDLTHLNLFTALQYLTLGGAQVSLVALSILCTQMPQIKVLCLNWCEGLSSTNGRELQSTLHDLDHAVEVLVVEVTRPVT